MLKKLVLSATAAAALIVATGCAPHYAPPPPPMAPGPNPNVQLALSNGDHDGRMDGRRAADMGYPPRPRGTEFYARTPGYDPRLGRFEVYQNTYRNAYLRGYDIAFRRHE